MYSGNFARRWLRNSGTMALYNLPRSGLLVLKVRKSTSTSHAIGVLEFWIPCVRTDSDALSAALLRLRRSRHFLNKNHVNRRGLRPRSGVQCGPTALTRKPFIRSMKVISRVGQS